MRRAAIGMTGSRDGMQRTSARGWEAVILARSTCGIEAPIAGGATSRGTWFTISLARRSKHG